jgi:hypothetical protein
MKIYNEVVYQIVDDKLVKVTEDSFDYEGDLVLCGPVATAKAAVEGEFSSNRGGGTVGKMRTKWNNATEKVLPSWQSSYEKNIEPFANKAGNYATEQARRNNLEKPGGTVKKYGDIVKDWSGKAEKIAWGTDSTETDTDTDTTDDVTTTTPLTDPDIFDAGDDDASDNLKANRKKQELMRGRLMANQTQGQSASLITA